MDEFVQAVILLLLFDFFPSIGDISSDIVNSLDMLGYQASHIIINEVFDTTQNILGENAFTDLLAPSVDYRVDEIWGTVGMTLVFTPGMFAFVFLLVGFIHIIITADSDPIKALKCQSGWWSVLAWFCVPFILLAMLAICLCFPVAMIILQIVLLFRPFIKNGKKILTTIISFEALFESSPQLHLQLFTLMYGYEATTVQIIAICLSFVLLSKSTMMFDLLDSTFEATDVLSLLPAYVTSIIFKIGANSIQMAFLREFACIPLGLQIMESLIIAIIMKLDPFESTFLISGNMSVMTMGPPKGQMGMKNSTSRRKFLRWSSGITFLHSSIAMVSILLLTTYHPTLMSHWSSLRPNGFHLTLTIVSLIGTGAINLLLQLMWNKKMDELD